MLRKPWASYCSIPGPALGGGGAGVLEVQGGEGEARQLLRKWQAGERGSPVIIKEQRCRGAGACAGLWGRLANGSLEQR